MNEQWGWEQAMFRDKIQASDNKKKEKSPEVFQKYQSWDLVGMWTMEWKVGPALLSLTKPSADFMMQVINPAGISNSQDASTDGTGIPQHSTLL